MKTHTLRNKSSLTPILKFTPSFFKRMVSCYPEAICLTLHWFKMAYKRETGKSVHLDYEQSQAINALAGADERGVWHSKFSTLPPPAYQLQSVFTKGIEATPGGDLESVLALAQEFFSVLDKAYFPSVDGQK